MTFPLEQSIKQEAHRLGFTLAGVTTPDPPVHYPVFENWLNSGHHGQMHYLAEDRARARRVAPRLILPECRAILVLGTPYHPQPAVHAPQPHPTRGEVAAYAWGDDYHETLPPRLQALVQFIEAQVGYTVPSRWYTDTGPLLERDLAMRAGLGWIGKNTCLINPRQGSYFFLSEILLGLDLTPDLPFATDHCGTCTRCLQACPTQCILPNRTLDARRCISYLTIELKDAIPEDLRPALGNHIFGCDICQQVCPWNRFAPSGDAAFNPRSDMPTPDLIAELRLDPQQFNQKFKASPVRRAKRRGYLRNVAVALGNSGSPAALPALQAALNDPEPLVREHAAWAKEKIHAKQEKRMKRLLIATENQGKMRELRELLADLAVELVTPSQLGLALNVEESGQTYAENAALKARAYAQAANLPALADDSGLEVDALGGAPGLYSARYHPKPGATDADRRAYLLENLRDKPRPWRAKFHATIAIALPDGTLHHAEGFCPGEIIPEERGSDGFGYDPIFLLPDLGLTMAELSMEQKNRLSHRARAVMNAQAILQQVVLER